MYKTDMFNEEMLEYYSAMTGAYTFFTLAEINKGTYNVKTALRDIIVNFIGNENVPVANVTDNQDIVFGIYDSEKKEVTSILSIPCKYSKAKAGKKEMTIYFPQKLMAKYHVTVDDIWFVFVSSNYSFPILGMMRRKNWILKFSEDRDFYLNQHIIDMSIDTMHLQNYRCFEDIEVKFNKDYTIFVGVNGTGKTSVLDGIAIGLSGFIKSLSGTDIKRTTKYDARISTFYSGKRLQTVSNFPVSVETNATIDSKVLTWRRIISSEGGRISSNKDDMIETLAYIMHEDVNEGNINVILPVIVYYGTDRLRNLNVIKNSINAEVTINRLNGYDSCLSSAIDYKLFTNWFEEMTLIELQTGEKVPELDVVKSAIQDSYGILMGDKEACKIDYQVKSKEIEISRLVNGNTEIIPIRMLSDGMRSVLVMVGDIAYRMATLNPDLSENITKDTPGVVIIDEIDMHLHPTWQRRIIQALRTVFPRIQLITTTHAPSVINTVTSDHLRVLSGYKVDNITTETYGKDNNGIVKSVMKVNERPDNVVSLFNQFYILLNQTQYVKAGEILDKLEEIIDDNDPELVSCRVKLDLEQM